MGLISKLLLKNYSIADLDRDMDRLWGGYPTKSGALVNQTTALRLSTLLACIRVRTESFGCLPCAVYKKRKGGGKDEATEHPLWEIVHTSPNERQTALTWRETMNVNFDADGNCYSLIDTNRRGQVISLYPIPWYQMEVKVNRDTRMVEYHMKDRGKVEILPAEKVYHVPGFGFDGLKGYSMIMLARENVGLGLAVSEFIQRFYGQGMNFGIALTTDKIFKDDTEVNFVKKQFEERYSGLNNAHRPIILHNGLKVDRIPISFTDAQTIEILKLTDTQICGLYRVPPHMVGILDKATFSNIEQQGLEYLTYTMLPILARHEHMMNWRLFTPAERAAGYFVKFNVRELLRGDAVAMSTALNQQRQNGVINADQWRELEDMNPIGGVAGQAYLVNGNMISTETAAAQQPKQTGTGGGGPPAPGAPRPPQPPQPSRNGGE